MLFRDGKVYFTEFAPMLSTLDLNPHVVLEDIASVLNPSIGSILSNYSQHNKNSEPVSEGSISNFKKAVDTKQEVSPSKTFANLSSEVKKKPDRKLSDREILANSVPGLNSFEMIVPQFQEPTVQVVQLPRNHPPGNSSNNETSSLTTKANQKMENNSGSSATSHSESTSTSVCQLTATAQPQASVIKDERSSQNLSSTFSAQNSSQHNEKQRNSPLEVKYLTKASDVNEILRSSLVDCTTQIPPSSSVTTSIKSSLTVNNKLKSPSEVKYLTTTSEVNEVLRSVIAENSQSPMSSSTHIMGLAKQRPNTRSEARLLAAHESGRSVHTRKNHEVNANIMGGRGSVPGSTHISPAKGPVDLSMLSSLISSGTHRYADNYRSKKDSSKPATKLHLRSQGSTANVSSNESSRASAMPSHVHNPTVHRSTQSTHTDNRIPEQTSVLEERLKKSPISCVTVKNENTHKSESTVCESQVATLPKFQQAFGKSIYNQTGSSSAGSNSGGGSRSCSSSGGVGGSSNSSSNSSGTSCIVSSCSSSSSGICGVNSGDSGNISNSNGSNGHSISSSGGNSSSNVSRCIVTAGNNNAVENGGSGPATTMSKCEDTRNNHGTTGGSQKNESGLQSIPKSSVSTLHSKAVQTTSISTLVSLSNPVSSALQADSLNMLMTTALNLNAGSVAPDRSLPKPMSNTIKRATKSSIQTTHCPSFDIHCTNSSTTSDTSGTENLDGIPAHSSESNSTLHKNTAHISRSSQVQSTADPIDVPPPNPPLAVTKENVIRSTKNALLAAALQSTTPLRRSPASSGPPSSIGTNISQNSNLCVSESSSSEDETRDVGTQSRVSSIQHGPRPAVHELRKTTPKHLMQTSHSLRTVLHIPNSNLSQSNVSELPTTVSTPLRPPIVHTLLGPSSTAVARLPPQNVPATDALISHSPIEPSVSSTTLEQLREFESVLEQVTNTSQMKERNTVVSQNRPDLINEDLLSQSSGTVETSSDFPSTPNDASFSQDSYPTTSITTPPRVGITFVAQSPLRSSITATGGKIASPVVVVTSYCQPVTSPALSVTSQSSSSPCVTPAPNPSVSNGKPPPKSSKSKSKSVKSSPSTANTKTAPVPKPQQKPQEDEVTAQRIYAILDEYAEQLRNSPDLNNKPAPRRRSNPPTNPSQSSKRKKSSQSKSKLLGQQSSSSAPEMSPGTDDPRTMGSEDSSSGIMPLSQILDSPASSAQASDEPVSLRSTSTEASSESCKPVVSESSDTQEPRQQPRLIFAEAAGHSGKTASVQDDPPSDSGAAVVAGKPVVVGGAAVPLYVPGNVRQVFLPVTPGLATHVQGRPMVVSKGSKFIRVHQVTVPAGPLHLHQVPVVVRQMCVNKQSPSAGASVSVLAQSTIKQAKRPSANTSPESLSQSSVLHQLCSQQQASSAPETASNAPQGSSFTESTLNSVEPPLTDTVIKSEPSDDNSSVAEEKVKCEASQTSLLDAAQSASSNETSLKIPTTISSSVITSTGVGANMSSVISSPEDKFYQNSEPPTAKVKTEPPETCTNSNEDQIEDNQLTNTQEERSVFRRAYAIVINPPIDVHNAKVNRAMQRLNIGFTRHSTVSTRTGNQLETTNKDFASNMKPIKTDPDMLNSESESSEYQSENTLAAQLNHFSKQSGSLSENAEPEHSVNSVLNCQLSSPLPDSTYHLRKVGKTSESSQPAGGFQTSPQNTICASPLGVFPTEGGGLLEGYPSRAADENGCRASLSPNEPNITHTLTCQRNSQCTLKGSVKTETGIKTNFCDMNGPSDLQINPVTDRIIKQENGQSLGKDVSAGDDTQLNYCSGPYSIKSHLDYISGGPYSLSKVDGSDTPWRFVPLIRKVKLAIQPVTVKKEPEDGEHLVRSIHVPSNLQESEDTVNDRRDFISDTRLAAINRRTNSSSSVLTNFRKTDVSNTRAEKSQVTHPKLVRVERELKLQKSLSEECEDLGVDEPSTSDLFPEADLLLDTNSSQPFDQTLQEPACGQCVVDGTESYTNSTFKPLEYSSSSQDDSQPSCVSSDIHESNSRFRQAKKCRRNINVPNFDWKYSERKPFCQDIINKICHGSRENLSVYRGENSIIKCTGGGVAPRFLEDSSGGFKDNISDNASNSRLKQSVPETEDALPEESSCNIKQTSDILMKDPLCGKQKDDPIKQILPPDSCVKTRETPTVSSKRGIVTSVSDSTFCSSSEDSASMLDSFSANMIVSSLDATIPSPLPTLPTVIQPNDNTLEQLPSAQGSQKYTNTYSKRPSCEQGDTKIVKRMRLEHSDQYYRDNADSQEHWESSSAQEKIGAADEDLGSHSKPGDHNSDIDVLGVNSDVFSSSSQRFPSLSITKTTVPSPQSHEATTKTFEMNGIDSNTQNKQTSSKKFSSDCDSECISSEIKINKNLENENFNHKPSVIHLNSSKVRTSNRGNLRKSCQSPVSTQAPKKKEEKPGKKGPVGKQTIKGSLPKKR